MHLPCPSCGINLNVPDSSLGKNVKCSACGHVFLASAPDEAVLPPDETALTANEPPPSDTWPASPSEPRGRSSHSRSWAPGERSLSAPPGRKSSLAVPLIVGGLLAGVLFLCCGGVVFVGLMSWTQHRSIAPASKPPAMPLEGKAANSNPFPGDAGDAGPPGPAEPPGPVLPPDVSGKGKITFAEFVDRDTLKPTNVKDSFPPGQVHMIVRSDKPFNDMKMMVFYSREGAVAEQILGTYDIDPKWNLYTVQITLNAPGAYVVKAKTTRGELIAEGKLAVAPK